MKKFNKLSIILFGLVFLSACGAPAADKQTPVSQQQTGQTQTNQQENSQNTQLANPASNNCLEKGGQLEMRNRPGLGEYGVCLFEDNRQCEEWALFKGDCPDGGLKITGYTTEAAVYCAITGGEYSVESTDKQAGCKFKNGQSCGAQEYYLGACDQNSASQEKLIAAAVYQCQSDKNVKASFYKNRLELDLSDGRSLKLNQTISASGARYANQDESFIFWNKGDTAFIEENGQQTFKNCLEK